MTFPPRSSEMRSLRMALKDATSQAHHHIERTAIAQAIARAEVSGASLAALLVAYRPAWLELDARHAAQSPLPGWAPAQRVPLIDADLRWLREQLGVVPSPEGPDGEALRAWVTHDAPLHRLGALYVLEGSALGGEVLARRLEAAGLGGATAFHAPYGALARPTVMRFFTALDEAVAEASWPPLVAAACETFAVLQALHAAVPVSGPQVAA